MIRAEGKARAEDTRALLEEALVRCLEPGAAVAPAPLQYRSGSVPAEEYLGDGPLIRALGVPWVTAQRAVGSLSRKLAPRAAVRVPALRPPVEETTPAP
jgi:hypothetical protein